MFYIIINLQTFFGNLIPRDFTVFGKNVMLQGVKKGFVISNGEDFVGEFLFVPEIVFETGPDDFGDTRLLSENESIAVVSGFESGEPKGFGNGTHDKNIGNGIDITETFTTDESSKNDVFTDAEVGSELN